MEIYEFAKEYVKQYSIVAKQFQDFFGEQMKFSDIDKASIMKFSNYLSEKYTKNSATTKKAQLKALLNKAVGIYQIPYLGYADDLKGKRQDSTNIYLSVKELDKVKKVKLKTATEEYARAVFLIQAWTGARYSDAKQFDKNNIQKNRLEYVTQKTGTRVSVPLKPIVLEMIKRKENLEDISIASYESNIKAICYKAGIRDIVKVFKGGEYKNGLKYQFVTGHTARRSFATNLMLAGVDMYTISKLMGHTSPIMTQKYICEIEDNANLNKILS